MTTAVYPYCPQGLIHVINILNKTNESVVYHDPDIDGIISGILVERFLDKYNKPYEYVINSLRQHGMKIPKEEWHKYVGKTFFVVDAGMSKELLIEMVDYGINVINIDHHHISYNELVHYQSNNGCEGVLVNNNYHFEPTDWNFLSGAGVVYYTIQNICGIFGDEEEALVGLTLLSDVRDLSTTHAKELLWKTYSVRTPYLAYLVDVTAPERNYGFGSFVFDRNYVDYTFSPKINASLRCGLEHEIVELFRGRYPYDESRLSAIRDLQNRLAGELMSDIKQYTYSDLVVGTIPSTYINTAGVDITTLVGLTCSKIVSKENKTAIILVLNEDGTIKRGSLRGKCHDVDYLYLLRSQGVRAEGHAGAFGILEMSNDVDFNMINNLIAEKEFGYTTRKYEGRIHEVSNLAFFVSSDMFNEIANYNNYVRDYERIYLKYTGGLEGVERNFYGKKIEYTIDGITVTCFDEELTLSTDLLLPLTERGQYKNIFMHRY